MLVTCAALFALGVVIAVTPDGPVRLWLDGGGSATPLRPGADGSADGAFPSGPVSLLPGGSSTGSFGDVTLASPVARTDRPGAVRLRANTRVERRTARTPAATSPASPNSPNRTAPAATPSPLQPTSRSPASSKPAPVATAAPGSSVEKSRGRPTSPAKADVPKERVAPQSAPAPQSTSSAPESRSAPAPAPEMRPTQQPAPQDTGAGVADGVLHRVPPPS